MVRKILLCNDDGIDHLNIRYTAQYLRKLGYKVIVCAPDKNYSSAGHAVTIFKAIKLHKHSKDTYSSDGTPVDCVMLGTEIFKPDIVIAGPNPHPCTGYDVFRSATLAAAMQAAFLGYLAIAIAVLSRNINTQFKQGKRSDYILACQVIEKILESKLLIKGTALNINVPSNGDLKNVAITKCFNYNYQDKFLEIGLDCRNDRWYRITYNERYNATSGNNNILYDIDAIRKNFISITPITLDMTDYKAYEKLKKREFNW